MANKNGLSKLFVPTNEHIEIAKYWLNLGFNTDKCALKIINPESNEPIAPDTFTKAFKKEIREAMLERLEGAALCFANAAQTDPDMASRYINTRGRGYFKERFNLDTSVSIKDQYDQVLKAASAGLISSEEATHYASVLKNKEESLQHKLLKLLEGKVSPEEIDDAMGGDKDVS